MDLDLLKVTAKYCLKSAPMRAPSMHTKIRSVCAEVEQKEPQSGN